MCIPLSSLRHDVILYFTPSQGEDQVTSGTKLTLASWNSLRIPLGRGIWLLFSYIFSVPQPVSHSVNKNKTVSQKLTWYTKKFLQHLFSFLCGMAYDRSGLGKSHKTGHKINSGRSKCRLKQRIQESPKESILLL